MQYFHKVASGLNVFPLMHALQKQPDLWNGNRFRTTFPGTPHGGADDILLRFSRAEKLADASTVERVIGDADIVWHQAAQYLPQAQPLVLGLMAAVGAYQLDRLLITRLRPGQRILPHADNEGAYVNDPCRARYHIVLRGEGGNLYRTGDETVEMRTGDAWWFDALTEHECFNAGAEERIHLLVDLVTWPTQC